MIRVLSAIFALCAATQALACGETSVCPVGERHYQISFPEGHEAGAPIGALLWSHGYRGSSAGVMRNGSLKRMVHDHGLALIAMQGVGGTWDLPLGPRTFDSTGAEEFAYFEAVIADAAQRFAVDTDRLIASGFSAGGMVTWYLACKRPDSFAGFIPVSGTYWLRPPDSCETPAASLVHIHGDSDRTVPLNGRPIGGTKQGEVSAALAQYVAIGAFGPAQSARHGDLRCEERGNARGDILEFCLFEGAIRFGPNTFPTGSSG
ncbi:alpha/beta hydrolase family esterase [Sulfitobacter albidus]|uniref:alpha/beta hydrolase family esterase n=1 Tax=Sulfitobacter albidus TaxID=2829501 RepID=UPI0020C92737|nr:prolyl oligopeptidase family serine peptidase [Sulfitobacter albidus]